MEKIVPPTKKYWAFISYSSQDSKWGKWLHKRLESYPVPKEMRGLEFEDGSKLGKHLRPVFRDRDELAGSSELAPAIQVALEQSRCLIVLCSPNAAKSKWVNKEIEDFKSIYGTENILALIVDGEPNATSNSDVDSALECFPPGLRLPLEPLAGDLRAQGDGRTRGFLKIIAGIAGVGFDQLYRRHERLQRRSRMIAASIGLIIVAALAGLSVFAFYQKSIAEIQKGIAVEQADLAQQKTEIAEAKTRETQKALVQVENAVDVLSDTYADLDLKEVRRRSEPLEAVLASRLVEASEKLTKDSVGKPELVAKIQKRLARSLLSLGRPQEAVALLEASLETTAQVEGPESAAAIELMQYLALANSLNGNPGAALKQYQVVTDYQRTHLGPRHRNTIVARSGLAKAQQELGDLSQSHQAFQDLYRDTRDEYGDLDWITVDAANDLASSHSIRGEFSQAVVLLEKIIPTFESQMSPEHMETLSLKNNLAIFYSELDQHTKARDLLSSVLDIELKVLGESHPSTLNTMSSLGSVWLKLGDAEQARSFVERSWKHCSARLAESNVTRIQCAVNLALVEQYTGQPTQAIDRLTEVLEICERYFISDHRLVIRCQNNLASLLLGVDRRDESVEILTTAMASSERKLGLSHPLTLTIRINLGQAYSAGGDHAKAIALLQESLDRCNEAHGRFHNLTLLIENKLATTHAIAGDPELSKKLLKKSIDELTQEFGPEDHRPLNAKATLGTVFHSLGDAETAVDLLSEVANSGAKHPSLSWVGQELTVARSGIDTTSGFRRLVANEIAKSRNKHPANSALLARDLLVGGNSLLQAGMVDEAEPLLRESLTIRQSIDNESWESYSSMTSLGQLLLKQNKVVEAESTLLAACEGMYGLRAEFDDVKRARFFATIQPLIQLYRDSGEKEKGGVWKKRWLEVR